MRQPARPRQTVPLRALPLVLVLLLASCTTDGPEAAPVPPHDRTPTTALQPTSSPAERGPAMRVARASHTATPLPDGRVLIAGGCVTDGCADAGPGARAEFYDATRHAFADGPSMSTPRVTHTGTALADGRVLLAGGWPGEGQAPLDSAEVYDPRRDAFVAVGAMTVRRGGHTATRLRDGTVLVVGGTDGRSALASVERFDPDTGTFRRAAPMPGPRMTHAAARLADNRVMVAGGQAAPGHDAALLDTVLLYDPDFDRWEEVGARLPAPVYKLAAAALPDGTGIVIGGQTTDDPAARLATTSIVDPRAGTILPGPKMHEPRYKISEAVVTLPSGAVVVAGGSGVDLLVDHVFVRVATGDLERQTPALARLPDGTVLVTGGYDNGTRVTASALVARVGG